MAQTAPVEWTVAEALRLAEKWAALRSEEIPSASVVLHLDDVSNAVNCTTRPVPLDWEKIDSVLQSIADASSELPTKDREALASEFRSAAETLDPLPLPGWRHTEWIDLSQKRVVANSGEPSFFDAALAQNTPFNTDGSHLPQLRFSGLVYAPEILFDNQQFSCNDYWRFVAQVNGETSGPLQESVQLLAEFHEQIHSFGEEALHGTSGVDFMNRVDGESSIDWFVFVTYLADTGRIPTGDCFGRFQSFAQRGILGGWQFYPTEPQERERWNVDNPPDKTWDNGRPWFRWHWPNFFRSAELACRWIASQLQQVTAPDSGPDVDHSEDLKHLQQSKIIHPTDPNISEVLNAMNAVTDGKPNVVDICKKVAEKAGVNARSLRTQVYRQINRNKGRKL